MWSICPDPMSVFLRGSLLPPYNVFVNISYTLWTWCQLLTAGPLSLLLAAVRPRDRVWTHSLAPSAHTKRSSTRRQHSWSRSRSHRRYRGSASNASGGSAEEAELRRARGSSPVASGSALPADGSGKRVTWARVPNVDQLMRAERILK